MKLKLCRNHFHMYWRQNEGLYEYWWSDIIIFNISIVLSENCGPHFKTEKEQNFKILKTNLSAWALTTTCLIPAPQIKTLLPIDTPALWQACTATDSGSKRAPSSNETWSGSLRKNQQSNNKIITIYCLYLVYKSLTYLQIWYCSYGSQRLMWELQKILLGCLWGHL